MLEYFTIFLFILCGSAFGKNPTFPGWYADPHGVVLDNKYWIFASGAIPHEEQTYFDAFSSSDMINWKKHPRVLKEKDVEWADHAFWSPAAFQHNGKYYLAFSAKSSIPGKQQGIGIAVADKPEGPYRDLLDHALIESDAGDPYIFIDNEGQIYMLHGIGRSILVKLSGNLVKSIVPFEDGSGFKQVTPQGYGDSSVLFERNGVYYYLWHQGFKIQYSTSKSVVGPFSKGRTIMNTQGHTTFKVRSASVIKAQNEDKYFLVYHRQPQDINKRVVCMEDMKFDGNGDILEMRPTDEGPLIDIPTYDQPKNPTFPGFYADPGGAVLDNKYWIFTSSTTAGRQTYIDAFSSSDMVEWKKHPHVLEAKDVEWADAEFWTPAAFQHNGKYYLAFSAKSPTSTRGIGIAMADKPEGPYHDQLDSPLIEGTTNGVSPVFPFIFIDKDGQIYMLYGEHGKSSLVKLSGNLVKSIVPLEDGSNFINVTPEGFGESSALFERQGVYYYLWSKDWQIKYSTSKSVLGPFSKGKTIMTAHAHVTYKVYTPSVIKALNQDKYFLVYTRNPSDSRERKVCTENIKFDGNGDILAMEPTDDQRGSAFRAVVGSTVLYMVAAMHFAALQF